MKQVRLREEAGFTLIEMLIVILIVGILAAVAAPLYLGYTSDAKMAEGKALVGSVWTSWQAAAQTNCGVAQTITVAYPKAGLSAGGATTPARWDVSATDAETLAIACATGAYTLTGGPVTTSGTATDITNLRIRLDYIAAATPPVVLTCSSDGGTTYGPC